MKHNFGNPFSTTTDTTDFQNLQGARYTKKRRLHVCIEREIFIVVQTTRPEYDSHFAIVETTKAVQFLEILRLVS